MFFICPTVDMGRDGNLNMSMDNEKMKSNFVGATNMEKGIYDIDANFYAPYYRQITFPVYSMNDEEAKAAIDLAYYDVKAAFEEFIKETIDGVSPEDYPGAIFDDGIYHIYDYQFFYRNLQENVLERIAAWEESSQLD